MRLCMKTRICFLIIVLFALTGKSQLNSYYLTDSAIKLMSTGTDVMKGGKYREATGIWDDLNIKGKIAPEMKVTFLYYAWQNKDILRFKNELSDLVRNYGFTSEDLSKHSMIYVTITENRALEEWFKSTYDKNRKEYLKEFSDKQWLIQKSLDYELMRRNLNSTFINLTHVVKRNTRDTIRGADSAHAELLWGLYVDLFETSRKLGRLPNDFDDRYFQINRNVINLMRSNMEINYRIEEKWVLLRPYLEHACNNGKINPWNYLYMADLHHYFANGKQLYGTLKKSAVLLDQDVPIEDIKAANEKRAFYGLAPLK